MTNESTRSAPGDAPHLLVFGAVVAPMISKCEGRGEDVDAVRRGFGAKSKVPVVMPSEAKSNGGGRKKFGSAGINFVVGGIIVVVVVEGIFVATTADEVPCRCFVFF